MPHSIERGRQPKTREVSSLPPGLPHYELNRIFRPDPDHSFLWHHAVDLGEDFVPRLAESSPPPFQPVDLEGILGVAGPWEIEICTGKGRFLSEYAALHPERGLLGVEWTRPIAWYAAEKLRRKGNDHHARIVWGDAFFLLRDRLPAGICRAFHIYFPDPWPKNTKRRVVQPPLLEQFRRLALPGCVFHWGTDHAEYDASVRELLARAPGFKLLDGNAPPTEGIRTSFETKYIAEGRPIFRSVWEVEPAVGN